MKMHIDNGPGHNILFQHKTRIPSAWIVECRKF